MQNFLQDQHRMKCISNAEFQNVRYNFVHNLFEYRFSATPRSHPHNPPIIQTKLYGHLILNQLFHIIFVKNQFNTM